MRVGVGQEHGFFGLVMVGVYSNADLAANYGAGTVAVLPRATNGQLAAASDTVGSDTTGLADLAQLLARRPQEREAPLHIFDIAGDRVVENAYWIVFSNLALVPVAFPLIVMTRGFAVDSLRSSACRSTGK